MWGISALFRPNNGEILTKSSDDILRGTHFKVYAFDVYVLYIHYKHEYIYLKTYIYINDHLENSIHL